MRAIVAADEHWGIGKDNRLLVSIPQDMKFFRNETTGKVVIMGRKTLESFPGGRPLPNRKNIVLTRDLSYTVKDATVVHSIPELLEELKKYEDDHIYIIGGESIYREMLPYCNVAHVTKVDHTYEADAFFPNLDEMDDWEITADSDEQTYFDIPYQFIKYERKK